MTPIEKARALLARADRITVLTGAGISAESGIATFRGAGGLWNNFRAEDLATPEAFARDAETVWKWYRWRRSLIAAAQPNAGHLALVEFERRVADFTLITQNVDGLHQRAGSRKVLKIHGDIWLSRCEGCGYQRVDRSTEGNTIPACPDCRAPLRPGVVWFGEPLPRLVWDEAERAVHSCQAFLVIGTAAQVYPAAGLISQCRAPVIEVNVADTPMTSAVAVALRGGAGEILPQLL